MSLPGNSQATSALRSLMLFGAHLPQSSRCARGDVEPEFILDLPDYYAFFTYSMFRGNVVG
jgi:hypothetical protein